MFVKHQKTEMKKIQKRFRSLLLSFAETSVLINHYTHLLVVTYKLAQYIELLITINSLILKYQTIDIDFCLTDTLIV
jgi:hypothetical protein